MKRCPECGREYDNTMMFCLDDGAELLYGPAKSEPGAIATGFPSDEPQTAILHATAAPGEAPTRAQIHTTEQTAILNTGAEAEPRGSLDALPEKHSFSASWAAKPLAAVVVAIAILVGGFFGYRYFSASGSKQINSIAVMPFENRNSDADTDYLSDGLAESVIFRLTQIPDLRVSPTSSVMRYKGKETDVAKIAAELGVDAVMTGRLTKRGDNLNITVELVDARTNKSLWGEQYERKLSELLTTQREIVAEIVSKLQLKLSGAGEQKLAKKYTDNNEAYQLYLKGRFHLGRRTKDDLLKGIEYFQQAINLDPNFALAYARIAETYNQMPPYGYLSPKEAVPQAKAAARKSLELDPSLAEGHAALANTLAVYEWNWTEAELEFKRAIELDPNSAATYVRYAQVCLSPLGRSDEAIAAFKRALEIEPLDLSTGALASNAYYVARQYDRAIEQAKTVYDVDPSHVSGRYFLTEAYNGKGMYAEAIELSGQSLQTDPTSQLALATLGYAHAKSGQRRKAEEVINRYKEISKTQYVAPFLVAMIYVALGEKEQAFVELEKSYAEQDWHCHRLKTEPLMDSLRDDPRYKDLLKRMNLPE